MGAHLARAGHDVTLVDTVEAHVDAVNHAGISIIGPDRGVHAADPRVHARVALRHVGHDHPGDQGASYLGRSSHAAPALDRSRVRRLGAEWSQRDCDRRHRRCGSNGWCVRQFRRGLHRAGRDPLRWPRRRRGRGDHGRMTPRVKAIRDAWLDFDDRAIDDTEHLGLFVGQGGVRRDAVRHRAHERVHRRRARERALSRSLHRARARDPRRRRGARA